MEVALFGLLCFLTVIFFIIGCFDDEVIVFAIVMFVATVIWGIVIREDRNNNTTDNVPAISGTEDNDTELKQESKIEVLKDTNGKFYLVKDEVLNEISEEVYNSLKGGVE